MSIYIRMAQGPQIYSTPKEYKDLSDVPLQKYYPDISRKFIIVPYHNRFIKNDFSKIRK
jgi:hypothetical protein